MLESSMSPAPEPAALTSISGIGPNPSERVAASAAPVGVVSSAGTSD